ncbi:MAG: carbamoylphosphate synthase large subunit, partial [Coprococcus catus]|nr:carbamoylphosphate synthase large subunit [Coprococcus catus]
YHDQIVMDEDIPEIISGAMGDHMWTARLDTEEQKDEFIDFVQATWQ